jgi:hypothetical protein
MAVSAGIDAFLVAAETRPLAAVETRSGPAHGQW